MNTTYIQNLKTPIAVVGLGKSGQSALNLLKAVGFSSEQLIRFDEKNPAAECTTPQQLRALNPGTLVVSPGVPLNSTWIRELTAQGTHLTSEISLAASLMTSEKIIGITGSVGKSTVASLLGVGARSFDPQAFVGGNLGTPFCDYALQILQGAPRASWVVLELSSYQLENCDTLKLDYSIITYLSANHLERYPSIEAYYRTKMKITSLTKNLCIINKTSADAVHFSSESKSEFKLINAANFSRQDLFPHVYLIGLHNKDNFSVAVETALAAKWPESSFMEMAHYRGLPHRLEFVATLNDVTFVNDSKATAMDSVLVAAKGCLENIAAGKKLYILLGGKDKNLPWKDLAVLASHSYITPVFFGACGLLARETSGLNGEYFEKLGSAINYCQKRAQTGDVVLLSPGGTSLDEFKNFEERGDFFKTLVLSYVEA